MGQSVSCQFLAKLSKDSFHWKCLANPDPIKEVIEMFFTKAEERKLLIFFLMLMKLNQFQVKKLRFSKNNVKM